MRSVLCDTLVKCVAAAKGLPSAWWALIDKDSPHLVIRIGCLLFLLDAAPFLDSFRLPFGSLEWLNFPFFALSSIVVPLRASRWCRVTGLVPQVCFSLFWVYLGSPFEAFVGSFSRAICTFPRIFHSGLFFSRRPPARAHFIPHSLSV